MFSETKVELTHFVNVFTSIIVRKGRVWYLRKYTVYIKSIHNLCPDEDKLRFLCHIILTCFIGIQSVNL